MSTVERLTMGPKSHFIGFHDVVPWNTSETHLLCVEAEENAPRGSASSIGVIDLSDRARSFIPLANTTAWTWHVGARQQWIENDTFLYNAERDGQYVAIFYDMSGGTQKEVDGGIWDITEDGRWALVQSLARSDRYYSTYGFPGGTAPSLEDPAPADDGLYLIDVTNNRRKLRFSVREVVDQLYRDLAKHEPKMFFWITHPSFNTDGTRFCFFLRHYRYDGSLHSDLFVAERDDGPARCLLRGLVSHFDWLNADTLLIYARRMASIDALRDMNLVKHPLISRGLDLAKRLKKALPRRRGSARAGGHLMVNVSTGKIDIFAPDLLVVDSHQQFTADKAWMICDTYPGQDRNQELFIFDMKAYRRIELGNFPEAERLLGGPAPAVLHQGGEAVRACNLHPRWNRSGTAVCFDWANETDRQIYAIDVSEHVQDRTAPHRP